MRDLVATQAFRYDGKEIAVGDEFHASDSDAKVLEALGRAKPGAAKQQRAAPKTRAMKSTNELDSSSKDEPSPEAGRYRRTDMRAED